MTPELLLGHMAGLNYYGFPGYVTGAPLPTLPQVLADEPPANTPTLEIVQRPGSQWRYSNGGYALLQLLLEDVTGQDFGTYLSETLLDPIGMTDSTFDLLSAHDGRRLRESPSDIVKMAHSFQDSGVRTPNLVLAGCGRHRLTWLGLPSQFKTRSREHRNHCSRQRVPPP